MRKRLFCMIGIILFILQGCSVNQGMDDYTIPPTIQEAASSEIKTFVEPEPEKISLLSDVHYIKRGDTVNIPRTSISVTFKDMKIIDSMYELEQFAGYDENDFIDKIKYICAPDSILVNGMTIDENGQMHIYSEDTKIIAVKINCINTSDKDIETYIGDMKVVDIDSSRDNFSYISTLADCFIDKMQSVDSYRSRYSFGANEKSDMVLIYVIPERNYSNLYLRCSYGVRDCISGESFLKVEMN